MSSRSAAVVAASACSSPLPGKGVARPRRVAGATRERRRSGRALRRRPSARGRRSRGREGGGADASRRAPRLWRRRVGRGGRSSTRRAGADPRDGICRRTSARLRFGDRSATDQSIHPRSRLGGRLITSHLVWRSLWRSETGAGNPRTTPCPWPVDRFPLFTFFWDRSVHRWRWCFPMASSRTAFFESLSFSRPSV